MHDTRTTQLVTCFCVLLLIFHCETKAHVQLTVVDNQDSHLVKEKGRELFALYRSASLAQSPPQRRVAYTCASGDLCGGLGDRLKGLASTFVLALLLEAEFVVEWTYPVPIDSFFKMPVQTNGATLRESAKNATTWSLIDVHQYASELKGLRKTDFRSKWEGHDFVSVHMNGAVWNHFVLNDHFLETSDKYALIRYSKRQLFEVVMKTFFSAPLPPLRSFILSNIAKHQGTFNVGVQIRFGGQWGDGKRYNGDANTVASCFVTQTLKTCRSSACSGNCSVFLTTDQPDADQIFIDAVKVHGIDVHVSKGDTVHSEKSSGDQSQHLKTFGDWYLLTMMSRLVNSRSGFSETASWFGNVPAKSLAKASTCLFSEEGIDIPEGAEYFSQER